MALTMAGELKKFNNIYSWTADPDISIFKDSFNNTKTKEKNQTPVTPRRSKSRPHHKGKSH
jgi:hypothetical protein